MNSNWSERVACASVATKVTTIGPSGLRATSGLAEHLRETTIFGIFPLVVAVLFIYFDYI